VTHSHRTSLALGALALLTLAAGCGSCSAPAASVPSSNRGPRPVVAQAPSTQALRYEVHEWGLVRGNMADHVVLSGPRRAPTPIPIAKPVLYVHRDGDGPLSIDVEVTLSSGAMVEHWPLVSGASGGPLVWRGVTVDEGTCSGARYPSPSEPPCNTLMGADGCEAMELATVETRDGDCLGYAGARWDHLFYRGELSAPPSFPLAVTPLGADRYRVEAVRGVIGPLVRVRGTSASVLEAPAPGASLESEVPTGSLGEGADALGRALAEAGLTPDEVSAFRRAWDSTLFADATASAGEAVVTATPMAGGLIAPRTRDALLYVLSGEDADRLATLRFTPAPTRVARAIVVWLDLGSTHLAYEPPY
jgi:hypothetical protein